MPNLSLQGAGTFAPGGGTSLVVPVFVDATLMGAPFSLRITVGRPFTLDELWTALSNELDKLIGTSLPQIPHGPWDGLLEHNIQPTVWVSAKPGAGGGHSAYLELLLTDAKGDPDGFQIGGSWSHDGFTITVEPNFKVLGLYIGHDSAAGGLDIRAKIEMPTVKTAGAPGSPPAAGSKTQQMVSYPFPLPSQNSCKTFQLIYFGLGQRVGPDPVGPGAVDPMASIFATLKSEMAVNDPETVLTTLAQSFYHPDRDWFVAAELGLRFWNLRVLFNDPSMYGLEITAELTTPPSFFAGLLFEILYQKLGPNLGVYYGTLDLPYTMRRIPLDGFILILPGFSIWIYTNGDFRVNVGWPVGPNSIGIQIDILTGYAGFYFAKLRSGDNPGAQPSVNYNPILEFGLGIAVYCQESVNASIFSATMSISLSASFQGLLAWRSADNGGGSLASAPDAYWFAGTASISVLLQGSVDFAILKASVTVSFDATVSFAMENDYRTIIDASADVSVEVSVHVIFFTIHLSFSAHISHTFTIGSGDQDASIEGPLAPGLQVSAPAASREMRRQALRRLAELAVGPPLAVRSAAALPARMAGLAGGAPAVTAYFVLQPTVLYQPAPTAAYVATLVTDCPPPGGSPLGSPGDATNFERLVVVLAQWMIETPFVASPPPATLSQIMADVCDALGSGGQAPGPDFGGSISGFGALILQVLQTQTQFAIVGCDTRHPPPLRTAAVLPMFADLTMSIASGDVDFASLNPTPSNYDSAIDMYFADMGLTGKSVGAEQGLSDASPTGPSMATLLFGDYYLLLSRFVAGKLHDAALAYEKAQAETYVQATLDADGDPGPAAAAAYGNALNPAQELALLLDEFDYAGAAGAGSRFLLQGLQLPDPDQIPADPTPQSMAAVPTSGLYLLTGQQFSDAASGDATATLTAGPALPSGWITFDGAAGSTAHTEPPDLAPQPDPLWVVDQMASPPDEAPGVVTLRALPAVSSGPLSINLNNQVAWTGPGFGRTLFPLPPAISAALPAGGSLGLEIGSADSPTGEPAQAALQIQLTASRVQQAATGDVAGGSPMGSPGGEPGFVPFVYQLTGADEATRDLIYAALQADLTGAAVSLAYNLPGASALQSDAPPQMTIVRNNLSTESQAAQTSAAALARLQAVNAASPESNFAPASDVGAFLRLIWELSVVNAPGYYLYYRTPSDEGLPSDLFADMAPAAGSPPKQTRVVTPGTSGGAAQISIIVELTPQPVAPTPIAPFGNAVFVDNLPAGSVVRAGLSAPAPSPPQGSPADARVLAYAPTYPAGRIGFEIDWTPVGASPPTQPLYHLIQYAVVAQGAYDGSVWSLPVGPEVGSGAAYSKDFAYRQVLPLTAFLAGGSPTPNRYDVIGQPVTLQFRLNEIYGNALPTTFETDFVALYNDPLLPPSSWPGTHVSYYFDGVTTPRPGPAIIIGLEFDPDGLVLTPSPASPIAHDRAEAQWRAIAAQYALAADQLADPRTAWSVVASLIGEDAPVGDPRADLQAFVAAVRLAIAARIGGDAAWDAPVSQTPADGKVEKRLVLPVDAAQVAAQPHDVVAIDVAFALSRPQALVDPGALASLPAASQVVSPIAAQLSSGAAPGAASPNDAPTSVTAFARLFEQAFKNFDGALGHIKVAQRATASSDPAAVPTLWAVRFSSSHGVEVTFGQPLTTFALRPLSTKPINGPDASGQTHTDVDLDAWAAQFLQAVDSFLSPQFCAAIAVIDEANNTAQFDALLAAKRTLAELIPLGLAPVLADETGMGNSGEAQETLEQALLQTLSSAYAVSAVVQAPASVVVTGVADDGSPPQAPPQLFGSLGAPQKGPQAGGGAAYSLTSAPLTVATGQQWLTSLLTVAQPTAVANVELPLAFSISYMQHDIDVAETWQGFTPSAWIKFAIPDDHDHTLVLPVTPGLSQAVIPVPLAFRPPIPVLQSQRAVAAPVGSPSNLEQEIAQALTWDYEVQISVDLAAQDELYFDVTYNGETAGADRANLTAGMRGVQQVFLALAAFRSAWPGLVAQFAAIPAAAFGNATPAGSPNQAAEVIDAAAALIQGVADTWPDDWSGPDATELGGTGSPQPLVDHYYLSFETGPSGGYVLCLQGRSGDATDSPPQHPGRWPTVSFALPTSPTQQTWTPVGEPVMHDDWWRMTLAIPAEPDLSAATLAFGPLSVLTEQAADISAWVVRNADLIEGRRTNPAFIFVSAAATFPAAVAPLIRRDSLAAVKPTLPLPQILEAILAPLAIFGAAFAPSIRVELGYAYGLGGSAFDVTAPILQADDLTLDGEASPGVLLAQQIADQTADWFTSRPRDTQGARLHLALTLFGMVDHRRLPLVQFLDVPILLPATDIERWMRGDAP